MNHLSVRQRLWALVILLIGAMLAQGVWGYIQQNRLLHTLTGLAARKALAQQTLLTAADVSIASKDEIQQFKDVLIRGQDPALYQTHHDAFGRYAASVNDLLDKLQSQMTAAGIDVSRIPPLLMAHHEMTARYEAAIAARYNRADPLSYRTADLAVRGIDKPTAEGLKQLRTRLNDDLIASDREAQETAAAAVAAALRLQLSLLLLACAAAITTAILVIRRIRTSVTQVQRVCTGMAQGDYEQVIGAQPTDEFGAILESLAALQNDLKARTLHDRERADSDREQAARECTAAGENTRIRSALDRVSVGVMLADPDGTIIYANDSGTNIFRLRAAEIRSQLPQFDAERIVGSSFDSFHRVPSHQRNLLAGLKSTHVADIKLGGATLRVIANPVVDSDGKRLGTVVQWIDRTQEVAIEEEVEATVADAVGGNLTTRIREEGKDGFFKILAVGVNRLVGNMADSIRSISTAAGEVGSGAEEISRGNADLSARTEQQASSLEETAASMEQMTAAVKNNADNAAQASQLALAARDQAERGGAVVQSAVAAMSEINSSSKKIADIIGVIDAIAFQTNLLALNAAVEAARAGEQGRGFAVVASEVRNLASRSAAAAKEIKTLIQESVSKVDDGAKLVDASGRVLQDIVTGVKKVTDMVAEIAASSQEQASGIEQVNKAVMSMDEVTQQNAALVEQAAAAAQALTEQSANLTALMARYQVGAPLSAASPPRRRAA